MIDGVLFVHLLLLVCQGSGEAHARSLGGRHPQLAARIQTLQSQKAIRLEPTHSRGACDGRARGNSQQAALGHSGGLEVLACLSDHAHPNPELWTRPSQAAGPSRGLREWPVHATRPHQHLVATVNSGLSRATPTGHCEAGPGAIPEAAVLPRRRPPRLAIPLNSTRVSEPATARHTTEHPRSRSSMSPADS